ncbi:protein hecd-1 [Chrysochromulina tobinii]|uniref:Protein hecd-1 n=1 Tax=Chrysochromulina tobinii TaxID=1460289 RepID=A0A0M0JN96_9EUKA|nr:protein hecd-1 [Chrysochromulina tobinii]|eukprot:KOO27940.1 protein hecd-1 [Chrysochromulina sp. CCMP291]
MAGIRNDLDRLKSTNATISDASPFRTACRNIIAACRNSPLSLANYCREGTVPVLASSLIQVSSNSQLCTCVLEVALALTQQLLEVKEDDGDLTSRSDEVRYAVGESVMARRMDGDFGEGTVLDSLDDGMFLVMWHEEEVAAKLSGSELMPFGSGMGLSTERRQRVAPAFILNNFLTKTAIPSNDLSRVQMVVRDGADVNCTDGDGSSPLNLAVSHGASVALIQFLISRGAHVNFVGSSGSALQIAAIQDNVEVVRCLLAHGADPALVDLDAAADDAASVLRETLRESEQTPSASQRLLSEEEEEKAAAECFTCLLPALLSALSGAQSPKLHKRVLMVLSYAISLKPEDVVTLATRASSLLRAVPQSGTVPWLLDELANARPAELRQRWADFERAFGAGVGEAGGEALERLLALLHDTLAATEALPVHLYASSGDGAHSLKSLAEPLQICLHPLPAPAGGGSGGGDAAVPTALKLSIDALVRVGQLQQHILRTSPVADSAYEAFCTRLLGCVVEERALHSDQPPAAPASSSGAPYSPPGGASPAGWRPEPAPPFRRATVVGFRVATPLRLLLHTLAYDDRSEHEVVMATREYRITGRVDQRTLEELRSRSRAAAAAGGSTMVADPDSRIHTVVIECPEGLPVELFLDNVLSVVRRALRQAEPGVAPMSRGPSDEYGWRDRGWERGGAQFERAVAEKLRDTRRAAVARRQTKHEAETLVHRLHHTVMVTIEVDQTTLPAHEGGADHGAGGSSSPYALLTRVQGLVAADGPGGDGERRSERASGERPSGERESNAGAEGAQWRAATVVELSPAGPLSLVYDDGSFEEAVPGYRVRLVPQPESKQRSNPLAAIFMSFEFLSGREERGELDPSSRDTQPANLRRTLSAFHIGRSQPVGRVPREALEGPSLQHVPPFSLDSAGGGAAASAASPTVLRVHMDTSAEPGGTADEFDIAPMRLRVRFALGPSSGEVPAEPGLIFDEDATLLHALQVLRESTASGRAAALEPQELGYHPGVTCDRTGQSPIVGNRYKLRDENYDVCEAEYARMPPDEQQQYTLIPPPVVKEVEADLLSGRLEPEAVLRELRRATPGCELRLSDAATRVLAASYGSTLAPLCSATLMAVYREVSGAPRATPTGSKPIPSPAALSELRNELRRADVREGDFADVLLLLCLFARRLVVDGADEVSEAGSSPVAGAALVPGSGSADSADERARAALASSLLSAKLQRQLSDALAVSSGALPQWSRRLLERCPALFTARARMMHFRSSAFGVSRAMHWSQEAQVATVRSAYAEEIAALERARLEAELGNDHQGLAEVVEQQTEIEDRVGRERLGSLRSDIARVVRERLLPMAERLMALHASSRHALEIQFEGESGFGSGVTQNFYSATANELLKTAVHEQLPIWVCETSSGAHNGSSGVIGHSGELFPLPLPPGTPQARIAAVLERFRFLGRLTAKACRDSFIVPLPLSRHFLHLVRGGTLTYAALPPPGATGGVASGYAAVCARLAAIDAEGSSLGEAERRRRYEREANHEFARSCLGMGTSLSLREWLLAGGCAFVCPLTGCALCDGGEEREVTVHNLQEYVYLLAQLWLADGVLAQANAFREGLAEVFPPAALQPFTLPELQTVLCGTMSIEWTEVELQRHVHPSGGYTKHSTVYQLLIDELLAMGNESRAKFLNFVTACPHLPPVGLSMLEIEVMPQHGGGLLPTAQTCGNKLYLPEYPSAKELRAGLAEAFANTEAGGLHEHQ